ncbi:MAG: glutamate--cysteine ligase [Alphaproteobacteria bacterium]|nr:glutamate--cysteine ligase [Alphaproteobacteria bacterium]
MGQELETSNFADADYEAFTRQLKVETDLVAAWEKAGEQSEAPPTAGFELEAWLVSDQMLPVGANDRFIERMENPLVVPELAAFNVEFNGNPAELSGNALSRLHANLSDLWRSASLTADDMGLRLAMIGILPTIMDADLSPENMTETERYKALNDQVFRLRKGKPINLKISGKEDLVSQHMDVMLEAAATSFQIHMKVPKGKEVDYYNASKLVSAPLVALSANSPYLFGKDLWAETRIPLFEQAVSVGDWDYAERVTFGVRFIEDSLSEVFVANRQRYPVLLPQVSDRQAKKLDHFRLQNGTIWRWNRPLVGWDADGTPHFRIEQRVVPAGPTIADSIANAAFYYGLITYLAEDSIRPHQRAQFFTARDNFYTAAKCGMDAEIRWDHEDGKAIPDLVLNTLLPMAREGLENLQLDRADCELYLGIIEGRCRTCQNGAVWQRRYVTEHNASMTEMLQAYLARQQTDIPVHEWPV